MPAQSTLAGGLSGLVAYVLSMVLAHYGITIPESILTPAVVAIVTVVVHIVPDIKSYQEFPTGKGG